MTILASQDSALLCPKKLAIAIGNNDAALLLNQIDYWLKHEAGKIIDGTRWIYNTYAQWQQEIPNLTEWGLRHRKQIAARQDRL